MKPTLILMTFCLFVIGCADCQTQMPSSDAGMTSADASLENLPAMCEKDIEDLNADLGLLSACDDAVPHAEELDSILIPACLEQPECYAETILLWQCRLELTGFCGRTWESRVAACSDKEDAVNACIHREYGSNIHVEPSLPFVLRNCSHDEDCASLGPEAYCRGDVVNDVIVNGRCAID